MKKAQTDRRFAILIGINDYDSSPLRYCVNDALSVAKVLEERCAFKKDDIITITSERGAQVKDISGHLEDAYKYVSSELIPGKDSIFFYFAGHGRYQSEKSGLEFHDTLVEINSIFNRINELQPKYQCYVIDACESGAKILGRRKPDKSIIESFIAKSSGILFMYAATESETATENGVMEHGLFTYYFLSAIENDSLYDEDGILTPNRIQDFIARETSKESKFEQTPVLENRTTGYYPFAFNALSDFVETPAEEETEAPAEQEEARRSAPEKQSAIDKLYFPAIPSEIRQQVLEELKVILGEWAVTAFDDFKIEGYELTIGNNLSVFNSNINDKLTTSIVEKSRSENAEAVKNLFSSDRRENKVNPFGSHSLIDAFLSSNQPQYSYYNNIHWYEEDKLIAYSINLKSNNIYKASCGMIIIVYQAIFGLGLAYSSFYMDYTGYSDTQINGPFTKIKGFKIHAKTTSNVKQAIEEHLLHFKGQIDKWNTVRQKAITAFGSKAE